MRFLGTSASLALSLATIYLSQTVDALDGAMATKLMGCYSSSQGLVFQKSDVGDSSGFCQNICFPLGKAVMAMTGGKECWCGDEMPNNATKVDDSNCSQGCMGYPADKCGSPEGLKPIYFSVWNSGLQPVIVNNSTAPTASATGSSTTSSGTTPTAASTIVVTSTATGTAASTPNTAGIAAGVVVGVIAIAAIAGGIWFYFRRKVRRELEEEHKRQATVNAFIASGKPGSSGGSTHDTRLDPVIMTQRRLSDGSIMDNQDYSRRILKVTNA